MKDEVNEPLAQPIFEIVNNAIPVKRPHRKRRAEEYYIRSHETAIRATIFAPLNHEVADKVTAKILARIIVDMDLSREEFGKLMASVLFDEVYDFVFRGTRTKVRLTAPEKSGSAARRSRDSDTAKDILEEEFGEGFRWLSDFMQRAFTPITERTQNMSYHTWNRVRLIAMTLSVVAPEATREAFVLHPW